MDSQKEYYAFISYKREDEKWAKWLQDKLEHYKFPTNLNGRTDLPKKIFPTFRDVTDLNPGLLAEEIDAALRNSQWLIVVCSPRSAKSPWVCKEAQTFIDLGRADRIIPFVIEGNPFSDDIATECYPEALLSLTGSKELLAANINEMGRDAAVVKVVARMFNLRFDTLWQRYKRALRKTKITKIIIASIIFSVVIIFFAYIYRQKIIINEKEKQEKISLCKRLASISMDEQEKGNMRLASLLLLNSLTYYDESGEIIPAEIECALNSLLYGDGNQLFSLMASFNSKGKVYCFLRNDDKLLSVDDSVFIIYDLYNGDEHIVLHNMDNKYGCDIDVSGENIVVSDFGNHVIYIYDGNSFKLVKSIEMKVDKWECAFSHNGTHLAILENRGYLTIMEIPSLNFKRMVYWGDDVDYLGKLVYLNNDRIISNAKKMYDLEQDEFTNNSFEIPEFEERMCDGIFETFISPTPNGKYMVIAYDGYFKQEYMQLGNHYRSLVVFKQEDAQIFERIVISDATGEDDYIRDIEFSKDGHYMAIVYSNTIKLFEFHEDGNYVFLSDIQTIESKSAYLGEVLFDTKNEKILISSLDNSVVEVYGIKRKKMVFKEDKKKTIWDNEQEGLFCRNDWGVYYWINFKGKDYYCKYNDKIIPARDGSAFAYYHDNEIIVYNKTKDIILKQEVNDVKSFDISSDGKRLVILDQHSIRLFDVRTGNTLGMTDYSNNKLGNFQKVHFSNNGQWIILQDMFDKVLIFSTQNNISLKKTIDDAFDAIISDDNKYVAIHWRFYNEYFSIEEINSGKFVFSTESHAWCPSSVWNNSADFCGSSSKILISTSSSYEIYDVVSGIMTDKIKNTNNGHGLWYENGILSYGNGVVYYPIESFEQKRSILQKRCEHISLTAEEKKRYGINKMQ